MGVLSIDLDPDSLMNKRFFWFNVHNDEIWQVSKRVLAREEVEIIESILQIARLLRPSHERSRDVYVVSVLRAAVILDPEEVPIIDLYSDCGRQVSVILELLEY